MGRSSLNLLIPARFLLTVGHLVSVLTMVHTRKENLSSAASADPKDAQKEFIMAYAICLVCFAVDVLGILMGTSLFFPKANLLQIICHFVGSCFITSMITQSWQYQYIWFSIVTCNIPCALCETSILIGTFALKVVVF